MPERLRLDARELVLTAATEEARRRGDRRLGTEHLVLGLLHDRDSPATRALGVSLAEARATSCALDVAALAAVGVEIEPLGEGTPSSFGRRLPPLTSGAQAVLKSAIDEARPFSSERVDATRLALALLSLQRPDPAAELLGALGIDPVEARKRLGGPAGGRLSGSAPRQDVAASRLPAHHISRPRLTAGCVERADRCRRGRRRLRQVGPRRRARRCLGSRARLGAARGGRCDSSAARRPPEGGAPSRRPHRRGGLDGRRRR